MAKINFKQEPKSVGELLPQKLGANYIGASTAKIRGWSSISNYMTCDRMFYYRSVKKYRPQRSSPALDLGILLHECLANYYSNSERTFDPIAAIEMERPEIALEAKRILYAYLNQYAKLHTETWDVRAVETEIIGKVKYQDKEAEVYSRLDLLIRKKEPNTPSAPYGVCKDGVWLVDHKFVARISNDLTEGYRMDGQFLLMAYLWKQQKLDEVYGPLKGFIINIVSKTKEIGFKPLEVAVTDEDLLRFEIMMAPVITELHSRLSNADEVADERNWPMNFAACKSPRGFGPCEFLDLCMSHGRATQLYALGLPKKLDAEPNSPVK